MSDKLISEGLLLISNAFAQSSKVWRKSSMVLLVDLLYETRFPSLSVVEEFYDTRITLPRWIASLLKGVGSKFEVE